MRYNLYRRPTSLVRRIKMSKLGKLIVDCPIYGHEEYIINTAVAEHVQDATIKRILKYHPSEAIIDFEEIC